MKTSQPITAQTSRGSQKKDEMETKIQNFHMLKKKCSKVSFYLLQKFVCVSRFSGKALKMNMIYLHLNTL
jgi:hypothetical protein